MVIQSLSPAEHPKHPDRAEPLAGLRCVKARPVKLRPGGSIEQGFRTIARNCLAQIRSNERGTVHSDDPEFVHQMRVGLRRLRSALRLFKRWLALPEGLQSEIDWLGSLLAGARDAEVLAGRTLPELMRACPQESGLDLARLQAELSALARQRRSQAAQAVASARYQALIQALTQWVERRGWRAMPDKNARKLLLERLGKPLDKAAARLLNQRLKKVRICGQSLAAQATPEDRHRLRIAIKKMRYATEFFSSLTAVPGVQRCLGRLARLTALQEALGELNDASVAATLLARLDREHPGLSGAIGFTRGFLCARALSEVQALSGSSGLWQQFVADPQP